MSRLKTSARSQGGAWIALALILQASLNPFIHTTALAAQKSAAELPSRKNREEDRAERYDSTRPRTVGKDAPAEARAGGGEADGPLIRVGLISDATTVTINSSSGLIVRRSKDDDASAATSVRVRIETRQQAKPAERKTSGRADNVETGSGSRFQVEVATIADAARARKLSDDLAKKFGARAQTVYDPRKEKYRVLLGDFGARGAAEQLLERVVDEGYRSARVTSDAAQAYQESAPDSVDTNGRGAKRLSNPSEKASPRRDQAPVTRVTEVVAYDDKKPLAASEERLIISADQGNGLLRVGDRSYRGEIHLVINPRDRINVINVIAMEQYLRGVVPLELSPSSFPAIEALKAQAVAARTYAIHTRGRYNGEGFDLRDDARSQVYGGASAEQGLSDRAVAETRGVIAAHLDEQGKARPIEALYMSTCGGQTEDNELIFGGKPVSYLRSVVCSPDRRSLAGSDLVSGRTVEPLLSGDGRRLAREVALLDVLEFDVAHRMTARRLGDEADERELKKWLEQTARVMQKPAPRDLPDDITRLGGFARALASIFYGEGHARLMLAPADADYLLAGLGAESLSRESRAEVALLIRDGLLRPPANTDWRERITRSLAIETMGRALLAKSQTMTIRSSEDAKSPRMLAGGATAEAAEGGRLRLASKTVGANAQTAAASKRERGQYTTREVVSRDGAQAAAEQEPAGLELERQAWLFRRLGGESYPVDRVTLIGGERITYHVNSAGRVDFLEVEPSARGASSDRFSNVAEWRERISVEELGRRLRQSRVGVGQVEELKAHGRQRLQPRDRA